MLELILLCVVTVFSVIGIIDVCDWLYTYLLSDKNYGINSIEITAYLNEEQEIPEMSARALSECSKKIEYFTAKPFIYVYCYNEDSTEDISKILNSENCNFEIINSKKNKIIY